MTNGIGSAGLGDGLLPLKWQDGETGQLTQGLVHAKVSPAPAKARDLTIQEICGPTFSESSSGADLSARLASKLAQRLSLDGSIEYSLKWVQKATPAGRRYFQLVASARRTSDKDFTGALAGYPTASATKNTKNSENPTRLKENGVQSSLADAAHLCLDGWPKTPQASDGDGGTMEIRPGTTGKYKLRDYAALAGFNTPRATDGSNGGPNQGGGALPADAKLAGWATATARDEKNIGSPEGYNRRVNAGHQQALNEQAVHYVLGPTTGLFRVPTGRPEGARGNRPCLNPFFSLWLMGFPLSWAIAGLLIPKKSRRK